MDEATAAKWVADYGLRPFTKPLTDLLELGIRKGSVYAHDGNAYADVQPGNGTAYLVVCHDLVRPQAEQLASLDDAMVGTTSFYRPTARGMGAAARLGGEMLVALPDNGGVCFVMDPDLDVHPSWLEDKGFRIADAVPLAIYLSAFSAHVQFLRG